MQREGENNKENTFENKGRKVEYDKIESGSPTPKNKDILFQVQYIFCRLMVKVQTHLQASNRHGKGEGILLINGILIHIKLYTQV